jgi:hypothetical protein
MSHLPVPEIHKRDRDDATEALIREALEEEQQRKKAKKGELTGECELDCFFTGAWFFCFCPGRLGLWHKGAGLGAANAASLCPPPAHQGVFLLHYCSPSLPRGKPT